MRSGNYRIVVQGVLGENFAAAFDDMTQTPSGRDTVLEGPYADRSQLDGLVDQLRRLGIEIHSFDTGVDNPAEREIQG